MTTTLSGFEQRLLGLEELIRPVQQLTEVLQRVALNLDNACTSVDNVLNVFGLGYNVSRQLSAGINGDLDGYLGCVDRVHEALDFMVRNGTFKSAAKALSQLKSLSNVADETMQDELDARATRISTPIDPLRLLAPAAAIASSGGGATTSGATATATAAPVAPAAPPAMSYDEYAPAAVRTEMAKLVVRLSFGRRSRAHLVREYVERRSKFAQRSLGRLNLDAMSAVQLGPYARGSHAIVTMLRAYLALLVFERRLAEEVLQAALSGGGGSVSRSSLDDDGDGDAQNQVQEAYRQSQRGDGATLGSVLAAIVEPSLDDCVEVFESFLSGKWRQNWQFGSFVLIDVWSVYYDLFDDFTDVLSVCAPSALEVAGGTGGGAAVLSTLASVGQRLTPAAKQVLNDALDDIKKRTSTAKMPADGTVHELTSNTVSFCRRLMEYTDAAEQLLPPPAMASLRADGMPRSALSVYAERVIKVLVSGLEAKSGAKDNNKKADKQQLQATIFFVNNLQYVLNASREEGFGQLLGQNAINEIEKSLTLERAMYRQLWARVCEPLATDGTSNKKVIKQRFKSFNAEFNTAIAMFSGISVPDVRLREQLRQDARERVLPSYGTFLNRFENVAFTEPSKKGKYIKFDVRTLEQILNTLF